MKITKNQLKKLVREQVDSILYEAEDPGQAIKDLVEKLSPEWRADKNTHLMLYSRANWSRLGKYYAYKKRFQGKPPNYESVAKYLVRLGKKMGITYPKGDANKNGKMLAAAVDQLSGRIVADVVKLKKAKKAGGGGKKAGGDQSAAPKTLEAAMAKTRQAIIMFKKRPGNRDLKKAMQKAWAQAKALGGTWEELQKGA